MDGIASQLLEWPFLAFVFFTGVGLLFRKAIAARLAGGSITVSWGDKQIELGELAGAAEGSVEHIQNQIDELSKEIEVLRAAGPAAPTATSAVAAKPGELNEYQRRRVDRALDDPRYYARSLARLARIADVPESQLKDALVRDPEIVVSMGEVQGRKTEVARRKR